jgi:hypothetical protein
LCLKESIMFGVVFVPVGALMVSRALLFLISGDGHANSKSIQQRRIQAMARFLIEVPHEEDIVACAHVVEIFLKTGSHFLTHADWGCKDGDHRAWIIAEVDNKEQARAILPPAYRHQAKVVQLNKFTMEEIEEIRLYHRGKSE